MSLTGDIKNVIDLIKTTDINGCITGSSMLDENFDMWDSVPDVDVFVYYEPQLQHAIDTLVMIHGFEPLSEGEAWKIERIKNRGMQKDKPLSTVKLKKDDVIVNVTWKKSKNNVFSVLASFDMSIIMKGYDIPSHVMYDLRCRDSLFVPEDPDGKWSNDPKVAVPNPLRKQDVDMYGAEMWVRQFDRVIKYWNRGFDTRPMARFYIELIDGVIRKGQLFTTDKSSAAFQEFINTYEPLKAKMVEWLNQKEDC